MLSRILLEENSMYEANKPIIQTAYAVNNVIEAAERWSKRFNIGPFFFNEHIVIFISIYFVDIIFFKFVFYNFIFITFIFTIKEKKIIFV